MSARQGTDAEIALLALSQRLHRIDEGCSSRRQIDCAGRHESHDHAHGDEGAEVVGRHSEDEVVQKATQGGGARETNENTNDDNRHRVAKDAESHVTSAGTKRHPDSDLVGTTADFECRDPIDADATECQCYSRKNEQQGRQ